MSRWPIRVRLTAAFALAMTMLVAAAGLFVYLRVRAELNETVNTTLQARADSVAARLDRPNRGLSPGGDVVEPEEAFVQVISPTGRLLGSAGGARERPLDPRVDARAPRAVVLDTQVAGIEGKARVLAERASERPDAPLVVVGQTLEARDETLAGLLAAFAVGGPVAIGLASFIGYLLAAAGLAPVEAMRRRATEVSLERSESLPLPSANDEVRRLGETLNQMLARLRTSFERERRFVADASHELRTPVAVLKAEIEAALRKGSYGPEVRESLHAALEECDHLAQLAEDLLALARSGDGDLPVRPDDVPVRDLLERVRVRFGQRAERDYRRIVVEAPGNASVRADPDRLLQALGNLVDNALRHGSGTVTLRGRPADGMIELEVADQGTGFPTELGDRAFHRFTRGDAARTRGGAGLGLPIVQTIARAHGGEADIRPDAAATVRIRLPETMSSGDATARGSSRNEGSSASAGLPTPTSTGAGWPPQTGPRRR